MAEIKKDKEFLIVGLVSLLVVIGIFAVSIGSPSGNVAKVTHDVSGTTWTCTWNNAWAWEHTWSDGYTRAIDTIIDADKLNCDPDSWSCGDNICNDANEGTTCYCGQQMETRTSMGSGG